MFSFQDMCYQEEHLAVGKEKHDAGEMKFLANLLDAKLSGRMMP